MREFKDGDLIIHLPVEQQRNGPLSPRPCECELKMGNDFLFLPRGSCLRNDKRCTNE